MEILSKLNFKNLPDIEFVTKMPSMLEIASGAYFGALDKIYILLERKEWSEELDYNRINFVLLHELAHATSHPSRLDRDYHTLFPKGKEMLAWDKDQRIQKEGSWAHDRLQDSSLAENFAKETVENASIKEELIADEVAKLTLKYFNMSVSEQILARIEERSSRLSKESLRVVFQEVKRAYGYMLGIEF